MSSTLCIRPGYSSASMRIPPCAAAVLSVLWKRRNYDTGWCWSRWGGFNDPEKTGLADLLGYSRRSIASAFAWLRANMMIHTERCGPGCLNIQVLRRSTDAPLEHYVRFAPIKEAFAEWCRRVAQAGRLIAPVVRVVKAARVVVRGRRRDPDPMPPPVPRLRSRHLVSSGGDCTSFAPQHPLGYPSENQQGERTPAASEERNAGGATLRVPPAASGFESAGFALDHPPERTHATGSGESAGDGPSPADATPYPPEANGVPPLSPCYGPGEAARRDPVKTGGIVDRVVGWFLPASERRRLEREQAHLDRADAAAKSQQRKRERWISDTAKARGGFVAWWASLSTEQRAIANARAIVLDPKARSGGGALFAALQRVYLEQTP